MLGLHPLYIERVRRKGFVVQVLHHENKYMDAIRDFDYISGVYFEFLSIDAY